MRKFEATINENFWSFATAVAIAVLTTGIGVGGATAAGTTEDFGQVLEQETTLHHFQVDNEKFVGQRFAFTCPSGSLAEQTVSVYGSDEYPASTPICLAAQHAGAISSDGGDLTLQLNPGSAAYTGSVRNGVSTEDFAGTDLSIVFLTDETREKLDALQNELVPTLKWKDKFSQTGLANIRLTGQRFAFNCPAAPEKIAGRRVYGTDSYPLNAYVCLSAVHAGQISLSGGPVLVQMDPALEGKFRGSERNGVDSKDGPKTVRSISFPAR
ncbi:LCCL domain-containing protein [Roseibium sp. HPY-6]|uniref:LCCL domain-containing protein n=1 Tax=Roseibium sp. HPY-6 TaxID=3229852 RepID=UPI00338E06E3